MTDCFTPIAVSRPPRLPLNNGRSSTVPHRGQASSCCGRLVMSPGSQAVLLYLMTCRTLHSWSDVIGQPGGCWNSVGSSVGKYWQSSGFWFIAKHSSRLSAAFVSLHDESFGVLTFSLESTECCHLFKGGLTFIFGNWEPLKYYLEKKG